MAEKYRSLLQQPMRSRRRRQDAYDLAMLLQTCHPLNTTELMRLLDRLVASAKARGIEPHRQSLRDPLVRSMTMAGYEDLESEIEGALPPFDTAIVSHDGIRNGDTDGGDADIRATRDTLLLSVESQARGYDPGAWAFVYGVVADACTWFAGFGHLSDGRGGEFAVGAHPFVCGNVSVAMGAG